MQRWYTYLSDVCLKLDERVLITACDIKKYIPYDLVGRVGTIKNYRCSTGSPYEVKAFAIKIYGLNNPGSEKGLWWISPEQLEIFNEKEYNNMFRLSDFEKGYKLYELIDPAKGDTSLGIFYGELSGGDYVVCDYGYSNKALSVRIVSDLEVREGYTHANCEIMGVANVEAYQERKRKAKKREEFKAKMKERMAKYNEELAYKLLAENDEEMAALYKEYSEI